MLHKIKVLLTYLALVPLVIKIPQLCRVWGQSPLDRFDGIFWGFAAAVALLCSKKISRWCADADPFGSCILAISIATLVLAEIKSITVLYLIGATAFAAGAVYTLWGCRAFVGTLPIWGILLLGCPSSNFWSGYWLQTLTGSSTISGFYFKIPMALILAGYLLVIKQPLPLKKLFFPGFVVMLLLLVMAQQRRPLYGVPIQLAEKRIQHGDWLGHPEMLTAQDQRFFGDSRARRMTYFNQNSRIFLLMIRLGSNVHNIHPTELCLKTARSHIVSSRERLVGTTRGPLALQELIVERGGLKYVVYTWYSCRKWSSGNFLTFRRAWRPNAEWYSYQLQTPALPHVKEAQRRLRLFIDGMLEE